MNKLPTWVKQPTTIAGIAASFSTMSALLLGQVTWPQALSLLIGAFASIIIPDNTGDKTTLPGPRRKSLTPRRSRCLFGQGAGLGGRSPAAVGGEFGGLAVSG